MVAAASTLLKTLLGTGLIAAFAPLLLVSYRRWMIWGTLLSIFAFFVESLSITYFYIYGGRVAWTLCYVGFIDISFSLEPLGLIFLNLLAGLWFIASFYSFFYMRAVRDLAYSRFLTLLGLAIFAASIIALASNLFVMFIGYETLTLITIPLIAHYGIHNEQVMKYIRILIFSSVGMLLPFIFLVQFYAGSTQFALNSELGNNIGYYVGHLLLFLSIFGIAKAAIYPLHTWLPAAMIAPYPVSALLHAVAVVKAGLFCIFKIIIYIFGFDYLYELTSSFNWPLMIAIFTMLYASYKAVTHDSIKNILAYSTISQLALTLVAAFIFTEKSMEAAITHMIAHSFAKIVLFFTAGRFYSSIGCTKVNQLGGLGYKLPVPAIFFILASLSLVGFPMLAGSYSKHLIFEAVLVHEYSSWIIATIMVSTICTIWYLGKIIYQLFRKVDVTRFVESADITSIFARFHMANSYGMDSAVAMCCVSIAAFPIVERFLQSILHGIL